ncbi:hypothetical protein CEXT_35661 [Caerostris extrusa]|uniref:Uncharacterized protein n=1 Tax=Caerostris extrusa TaxID=172846 RepID=A0AAV4P297_CAEEX|nr:hypothetical protein CEXT_35661 [Caerostris extrusa]
MAETGAAERNGLKDVERRGINYAEPHFFLLATENEELMNPGRFLHREGGCDSTWLSTCSGYPPEEVSSDFRSASQIAASGKKVEGRKEKKRN